MLLSHYAPGHPVRLDATSVAADEALLAFGPEVPRSAAATLNLSPAGDLTEAAAHLFDYLHRLDALPVRAIVVMPIPTKGLGAAINDRLRRAAAPGGGSPRLNTTFTPPLPGDRKHGGEGRRVAGHEGNGGRRGVK